MIHKTFGIFIQQAAKYGIDKAAALAIYVGKRSDGAFHVRENISKARFEGHISHERAEVLNGLVDECVICYNREGKFVDHRDPRDWHELGNGARVRKVHKDSDKS